MLGKECAHSTKSGNRTSRDSEMNAPCDKSLSGIDDSVLTTLRATFGERLSTAAAVREQHGRGESPFRAMPPDAVVFVESTEEVCEVLKICNAHRVPAIAFGAGSS